MLRATAPGRDPRDGRCGRKLTWKTAGAREMTFLYHVEWMERGTRNHCWQTPGMQKGINPFAISSKGLEERTDVTIPMKGATDRPFRVANLGGRPVGSLPPNQHHFFFFF